MTLTTVPDELAAEIVCGRLRSSGIECMYRRTDLASASGTFGGGYSLAGPTEILVDEHDLDEARRLLPPDG
ncbi:MAG TPA: DUF2007 domain-containing protein [Gaiellaceae bacterium]